ncbi:glycosyltransferase family 4 protein [Jeotgalicoccus sp. S0W5]|uniref:glycosyltransferase family 4 protein n=1 Tax=Jeotgalicoccus sp. S0W5 TaxID=2527874 RepID=UPI001414E60A|nr:glycosyltransferase family 4 protein [Jeotgalicoccus sp. S0W5]
MKPKIVQICALDSTIYKMLNKLNQKSLDEGFEVHCICSDGDYVERLKKLGYKVHPIQIDRKISLASNFKSVLKISKKLRDIKPDIVHVHTPIAALLGRIASKISRVNTTIYTAHGFYFHEGMSRIKYSLFYNIEKYAGRFLTDYIFTQSEEDFKLSKDGHFLSKNNRNNYLHISNGIDLEVRFNFQNYNASNKESIFENYNLSENTLILSFIGRMVKEKGIIDLIEAMESLNDYNDIHLFAIGGLPKSERDNSLSNLIEEGYHKNISFTGSIENVEDYLYSSDIFILPSYREGMPRSIIEAMAMKNAIIATDIRGSREEVVNNYNGFLIALESPEQIKEKILELYSDRKKLSDFKINSFERAKNLYDENKVVEKQCEIFKEVIS